MFLSRWYLSLIPSYLSFCKEPSFFSNSKQLLPVVLQEETQLHLPSYGCRSGRTSRAEFGHYRVERKTVYHSHPVCMPNDQTFDSTLFFVPFHYDTFFFEPPFLQGIAKKGFLALFDSTFDIF